MSLFRKIEKGTYTGFEEAGYNTFVEQLRARDPNFDPAVLDESVRALKTTFGTESISGIAFDKENQRLQYQFPTSS